jgi:hypothetical protein
LDFYETLHICSMLPADVHGHICDFYSRKCGIKRKITTFGIFPLQFLT